MAKIGLNNFRYGLLVENPDGTASYAGAAETGDIWKTQTNYNFEITK